MDESLVALGSEQRDANVADWSREILRDGLQHRTEGGFEMLHGWLSIKFLKSVPDFWKSQTKKLLLFRVDASCRSRGACLASLWG